MKADTVKLSTVFGTNTRYRVPLFQRPFVWQQDRQWEPLWDDLRDVADRQTDAYPTNDHMTTFMGAIVVDQEVEAGGPTTRLVIDGQQLIAVPGRGLFMATSGDFYVAIDRVRWRRSGCVEGPHHPPRCPLWR